MNKKASENIPIFRNTESFKASDVAFLKGSIQTQMDQAAEFAIKRQQDIITTKLQNDRMKFEALANDTIQKAWEANQGDPEKLKAAFDQSRKSLMQGVPFALRPQAEHWFNSNTQGYLARAAQNEINILNDESKSLIRNNIDRAFIKINETAPGLFSSDPDINFQASEDLGALISSLKQDMNGVGADGLPLMSQVEQFNVFSKFKETTLTSGIRYHFDELNTIEEKKAFLQKFSNGDLTIDFQDFLGNTEQIKVINHLDRGSFESDRNYMVQSIKSLLQNSKKDAQINHITSVLTNKIAADPANKIHIEAANVFYDEVLRPSLQGKSFDEKAQEMLEYVKIVEIFPDTMGRELKALTNSGDEDGLLLAAKFVGKAKIGYPLAYASLNNKEMSVIMSLERDLSSGVQQKIAIENAKGLLNPITSDVYRAREQEFRDLEKAKKTNWKDVSINALKDNKFFSKAPKFDEYTILPDQAANDYRQIAKAIWVNTRNPQTVQEVTNATFINQWGVSKVMFPGGNKMAARYPVEGYYGDKHLDDMYIRRQAISAAKKFIKEQGLDFDPEKVIIMSDSLTKAQAENNKPVTYALQCPDKWGNYEILGQNINKSMRFIPDPNEEYKKIRENQKIKHIKNINDLEIKYEEINNINKEQEEFNIFYNPKLF